jgi:hypothetical protein
MANDDLTSKAADFVKKALTVGVGAVFMTEESVRNLVSELKIPKELIQGLLEGAQKTKAEFFQKLSTDLLDRVSSKVDPEKVLTEFLSKNEIQITLRFRPKGPSSD